MIVLMHFGDGSSKEIEVEEADPDEAVQAASDWVKDNAWFEATDDDGQNVVAEKSL